MEILKQKFPCTDGNLVDSNTHKNPAGFDPQTLSMASKHTNPLTAVIVVLLVSFYLTSPTPKKYIH
jgi:hypothetical protein